MLTPVAAYGGNLAAFTLKLLGPGQDFNYRLYQLPCGHEQEINVARVRDGVFSCQTCTPEKQSVEAKMQGCELLGPGRDKDYRIYRLTCDHEQDVAVVNMRNGNFSCQICEDWAFTQPSQAYLLHIRVGSDEWLKLGFAKNINFRIGQYGLPSDADVSVLKTKFFDTGKEAQVFERSLHKKHKRKKLKATDMADFHTKSGGTECYPVIMVHRLMAEFK
jgi:hypothetical protein